MFTQAFARTCFALCFLGYAQFELAAQVTEAEAKAAAVEQLVDWLNNDRYQTRSQAHRELMRRGFVNLHALVEASFSRFPEQRMRAERILYRLRSAEIDAALPHPQFKARLANPRFWSGSNQCLGGIQDYSLDSDIHLDFEDSRVGKLLSPIRVSSAVSDRGEKLGIQIWPANWTESKQLSLYLQQPRREFKEVAVELRIWFQTSLDDQACFIISEGQHQIREGCCWLEVRKEPQTKQQPEMLKVTLIDYFGRLHNQQNSFTWSQSGRKEPQELKPSSGFRRTWLCQPSQDGPSTLALEIKSGVLSSYSSAKVICPHPDSVKK